MEGLIDRIAVDANAVIDFLREDRPSPPILKTVPRILLPLPVLGELYAGARVAMDVTTKLAEIDDLLGKWSVLTPNEETAQMYGALRSHERRLVRITGARINDLWIAALCVQHQLPLVTNDAGFRHIPAIKVIHW